MSPRRISFLFASFFALTIPAVIVQAQVRDLGPIDIATDAETIAIRVTGSTAEIEQLANVAFNSHGRYRRVTSGESYLISFSAGGPNQVRVDVRRGNSVVLGEMVSGTSPRHALLRAADVAVRVTSGRPGFFASKLTFINERTGAQEIYISDLFFGEVQQLTQDNSQAMTPRWAPDGSRIVYTSYYRSGRPDIFQIDLRTLQRTNFVSFQGTNSGARFSPNGQQVAMVLSGEGNPEVYVSNAQGRQVSRRTRTPNGVESSPGFSPDSSQIVYASDAAGSPQLYIMPAGGGSPRRLATQISGYCAEPDWSRGDPNKIAFTTRIGSGFQIAVFDLSKSGPAVVVPAKIRSTDVIEPSWLADGRHLVCTARDANTRSLWILDTETGKATRISTQQMGHTSQAHVLAP